jgi:hypothetical protein
MDNIRLFDNKFNLSALSLSHVVYGSRMRSIFIKFSGCRGYRWFALTMRCKHVGPSYTLLTCIDGVTLEYLVSLNDGSENVSKCTGPGVKVTESDLYALFASEPTYIELP